VPGESPTKWQAQAYRFGVRRLESAVASGDPLLRGDPVRRRLNIALIVSFVLAALILGGFAVYGFIRPAPTIGGAQVVIDSDTGGAFVSRNGTLYPAMNYASALLAASRSTSSNGGGKAPSVASVGDDAIRTEPRGPLLGIPGAPNVLPPSSSLVASSVVPAQWTVCEDTGVNTALPPGSKPTLRTTAILGKRRPVLGRLDGSTAMLVSADGGRTAYLLWTGGRSRISLTNNTVRLAFGLSANEQPRPISAAMLNVIPQNKDIAPPVVPGVGSTPDYASLLGVHVGDVFGLERSDRSTSIFVALQDGVQPVTPLVGDLIRDQFNQDKQLPLVSPKVLRDAPRANHIDLSRYPTVRPSIIDYTAHRGICVFRSGIGLNTTRIFAVDRDPLPAGAKPVTVTRPGALVADQVYVQPGMGAVLTAATPKQKGGLHGLFVITDDGVSYPVVSGAALVALGYTARDIAPTAPELLSLLPSGPALDPTQAVHFYPQTGTAAKSLPTATNGASPAG
jgi:type VII secretion protein EccB